MKLSPASAAVCFALTLAVTQSAHAAVTYSANLISLAPATDASILSRTSKIDAAVIGINAAGVVIGYTSRFYGSMSDGDSHNRDAWVYNPATDSTIQLGFTAANDASYLYQYQCSNAIAINDNNLIIGTSRQYKNSTAVAGVTAWVYNLASNSYTKLGTNSAVFTLTPDETDLGYTFTSTAGYTTAEVTGINNSNTIVGATERFLGGSAAGYNAWVYNLATDSYTLLGYGQNAGTNAGYTDLYGERNSRAIGISAAGIVGGTSTRYHTDSLTNYGQDAWLFDPTTNTYASIGLSSATAASFTSSADGSLWEASLFENGDTRSSTIFGITKSGFVAGTSNRYQSGSSAGSNAWFYNPLTGVTSIIGLTGGIYGTSTQHTSTTLSFLSESGTAAGMSTIYGGGSATLGNGAWFYSAATDKTTAIPTPTGGAYANGNGYFNSNVSALSPNGNIVAGYTSKYGANAYSAFAGFGDDPWIYNGTTGEFTLLDFTAFPAAVTPDTNGIGTIANIAFVTDTGMVLGEYLKYDLDTGKSLGYSAFTWTVDGGIDDLNLYVNGASSDDWKSLADALLIEPDGTILALGLPTSFGVSGTAVFSLTPAAAVPEPASLTLLGLASLTLIRRRRGG